MHRSYKTILALLFVLCFSSVAWSAQVVDRIVAVVNGEIITLFDLNERIKPFLDRFQGKTLTDADKRAILQLKHQMLDGMVNNILIKQEGDRLGIQISDVEVENEVRTYKKNANLSEEDFQKQLTLEGLTRDQFKDKLKEEILRHKLLGFMVKRKVAVTKQDIQRYYDAHPEMFKQNKQLDVSLILAGSDVNLKEIRARIANGEIEFADAANTYSEGPGAGQGGRIGTLEWRDLAPEWRDVLRGVSAGNMTKIFAVQGKSALILVNGVQQAGEADLKSVEDRIYKTLYQERLEKRFQEYIGKLKENALIEIKL
ncbi:SurA N-terminal domain-containing protein [Desulfobaculum bizertense]|uniref:Periplasmic chaperone for outer membrane proteins SurA n=1 Tax=Desulfobaculum bizertense DSM 18034 TaxID=1121442 RepID=A0A1T4W3L1_9BACT|nr:SurA N-terminal domain-containing protein [Desulfobaculum bizertense]SKA71658.1 periplasmic chaperone for outer membrane proteins SurA [Desulfobaculum bizertense DSM 18034]